MDVKGHSNKSVFFVVHSLPTFVRFIAQLILCAFIPSTFDLFILIREKTKKMLPALAVALGGSVGLAAGHPHPQRREVAAFPAGASWDIILNKGSTNLDDLAGTASVGVTAIDIDLFDNEASTISALKDQNKQVICYFSAGSREDWREDASKFKADDYGQGLEGWDGENWVNVKSENVRSIMKARIELAAQKGCTAVDPDNVDGFVRLVPLGYAYRDEPRR